MVLLRRVGSLVAWVTALVLVLAAMHALGRGELAAPDLADPASWSGWAGERSAPGAAMAVLRLVVLLLAWYLLAATVVAVVLRLGRAGRLVTAADVVTLPVVRSVVQAALGMGVAGASVAAVGSLGADPPGPPTVADVALAVDPGPRREPPLLRPLPDLPAGAAVPAGAAPLLRRLPDPAPVPAPAVASEPTWTVVPGDHLWSVAERTLAGAWQRAPSDAEVAPYWEQVLGRNRGSLADPANPDLLFPGQELVLPPAPPAP